MANRNLKVVTQIQFSARHNQALVGGQYMTINQCREPARVSEIYCVVPAIVGEKNIRSLRARIV